jgi:hypothetical protein
MVSRRWSNSDLQPMLVAFLVRILPEPKWSGRVFFILCTPACYICFCWCSKSKYIGKYSPRVTIFPRLNHNYLKKKKTRVVKDYWLLSTRNFVRNVWCQRIPLLSVVNNRDAKLNIKICINRQFNSTQHKCIQCNSKSVTLLSIPDHFLIFREENSFRYETWWKYLTKMTKKQLTYSIV